MSVLLLAITATGVLKSILFVLFVLVALLLILVVLLQEPKGGGLSGAFGGAGAETFGVQTGGVNKFTSRLAAIFILLAVIYGAWREGGELSASERLENQSEIGGQEEPAGSGAGAGSGSSDENAGDKSDGEKPTGNDKDAG